MSKVISRLLWFYFITLCDWLPNSRYFLSQWEAKPKPIVPRSHAFSRAWYRLQYLLRILIGPLCCLCFSWLVGVISLVLVLQHSIENLSNLRTEELISHNYLSNWLHLFLLKWQVLVPRNSITTDRLSRKGKLTNYSTIFMFPYANQNHLQSTPPPQPPPLTLSPLPIPNADSWVACAIV